MGSEVQTNTHQVTKDQYTQFCLLDTLLATRRKRDCKEVIMSLPRFSAP